MQKPIRGFGSCEKKSKVDHFNNLEHGGPAWVPESWAVLSPYRLPLELELAVFRET